MTAMTGTLRSVITAVSLAALVSEIAAVIMFLAFFFILKGSESVLEAWGLVARGWGDAHEAGLSVAAVVPTVLAAAVLAGWFYRRVVETERAFASRASE